MIGMAINIAKFRHPLLIPFDQQVWTAQSASRQAVLADGGVTGLRFLPSTLVNYLRPDGVRLSPVFPFLSAPAEPARSVGGVLLDMRYRTPSATAFMPLLFVLAARRGVRDRPAPGRDRAGVAADPGPRCTLDHHGDTAGRLHRAAVHRRVPPGARA